MRASHGTALGLAFAVDVIHGALNTIFNPFTRPVDAVLHVGLVLAGQVYAFRIGGWAPFLLD